ncbi:MAG: autotransporter-associated beta strand repeat-containing protein, partial [Verrucomicrobiales bacterium]|nr:autotransporter-associated beta strand repeat-containing protein [Verrucomicrobiales bacterium]
MLSPLFLLAAAFVVGPATLFAQTARYWDNNDTTAGAGSGGTWSATGTTWTTVADGTGAPGTWVAGDRARFSAGTDLLGVAYTITVSGTHSVSSLEPEEGQPLTITGGTLTMTPSGTVAVPRVLTVFGNTNQSLVINSVLAGTNGFETRFGSGSVGTIVLGGANTYVGSTLFNHGSGSVLRNGASEVIPDGSDVTVGSTVAVTWDLNNFNETVKSIATTVGGSSITLGSATLTVADPTGQTFAGVISGTGGLTKLGSGTLILSGNNTNYTGTTTISAGTLQLGAGGTAGTIAGSSIVNNGTLAWDRTDAATLSQVISGTGGINKLGTGTLTLSGANTYGGVTTVSAGALAIGNNSALGSTAGNTVVSSGAAINISGTRTVAEPLTLNGTGVGGNGALRNTANVNTWTGPITLGSASRIQTDASTLAIAGGISGGFDLSLGGAGVGIIVTNSPINIGSSTLTKDGACELTLGTANTMGAFQFDGGTIIVNNGGAFGSGTVTINPGAAGITASSSLGTITVANDIVLAAGAAPNLYPATATTLNLAGTISGSGGLKRGRSGTAGVGFVRLSGNNTFSGGVTLAAENLQLGHKNALGTGTFVITDAASAGVSPGAEPRVTPQLDLSGTNAIPNAVTVNTNFIISGAWPIEFAGPVTLLGMNRIIASSNTALSTISGVISGTVGLTKAGVGTIALSGANTFTGPISINEGTLEFYDLDNLGAGTDINFGGGTLRYGAGNSDDISVRTVTINAGGAGIDTFTNTVTLANPIGNSGAGGLTKSGTGTLILSAANTFTGPMGLNGGVVEFSALNNLGAGTAINFNGGTLRYAAGNTTDITTRTVTLAAGGGGIDTGGNNVTFANAIAGTGGLAKLGTGTLTLSAANTYTGLTAVGAGTLNLTGSVAGGASVASGATLVGTGTIAGNLSVSGTVAPGTSVGQLSAGGLTLNGGGTLDWEVNQASGTPGTDWDHINVATNVNVQATSTNPFVIKVLPPGGVIASFNNNLTNEWTFATAGGSVLNFDANKFTVDDSAVSNDLAGGVFQVSTGSLKVVFLPNKAPVANPASFTRSKNTSLKIPIATLLAGSTSDPDGHGRVLHHLRTGA